MPNAKNNRTKTISTRPFLVIIIIFTFTWAAVKWYKGRSTPIRCGLVAYAISYSPDGHYIALAGHKGSNPEEMAWRNTKAIIQIWDTTKWSKIIETPYLAPASNNQAYDWDRRFVTDLTFTSDNRYLMASANHTGSFGIYDIAMQKWSYFILAKHNLDYNTPIGFSTNDRCFSYAQADISKLQGFSVYGINQLFNSSDKLHVPINIITINLATGKLVNRIPLQLNNEEWPVQFKTLRDGNIICVLKHGIGVFTREKNGRLLLIDGNTKKIISSRNLDIAPSNILTTNLSVACLVTNKPTYQLWDLSQFVPLWSSDDSNKSPYTPMAISPNGSFVAGISSSVTGEYLGYLIKDKDGKTIKTLQGLNPDYGPSAFSSDGKQLVTAHMKKDGIEIWNVN